MSSFGASHPWAAWKYSVRQSRVPALEACEEAEGGLRGARATGDGQVVLAEVGGKIDELAESCANAEVAAGKVLLHAEAVVVDGAVLEGQAFAAARGRSKVDGSASYAEIGLHPEDLAWMGDVAKSDLVDSSLCAGELVGGELGRVGVVLGVAKVAEVVLEADVGLGRIAQSNQFADRAAGGDGKIVMGGRCIALLDAVDVRVDDASNANGQIHAIQLLLEGERRWGVLREGLGCGEAEEAQQ